MATSKDEIRNKYIIRNVVEQPTPTRNLQPEISQLKSVIKKLGSIETSQNEWARLAVEVSTLQMIIRSKLT